MKLISRILNRAYRMLYWPVCRTYARYLVGNKPADQVMVLLYSLHFLKVRGYWPNLKSPRSFEEKLSWRMLFDRNPLWTMVSDKLSIRKYVAKKVGSEFLIPLLWNGDNPEDIPFGELPQKFVIKANHGCGYNIIVKDKNQLDETKAKTQLKQWLGKNYCENTQLGVCWGYNNIRATVMVELFLDDNGSIPLDYKFFCFSGRVELLQMNFDRFGDPHEKTFDRHFNALDLWQGTKQYAGIVLKPDNYDEMIRIAESLAENLDFIRVDLYNVEGKIFVGELTCYPGGGMIKWIPRKYDYLLGERWKMIVKQTI